MKNLRILNHIEWTLNALEPVKVWNFNAGFSWLPLGVKVLWCAGFAFMGLLWVTLFGGMQ